MEINTRLVEDHKDEKNEVTLADLFTAELFEHTEELFDTDEHGNPIIAPKTGPLPKKEGHEYN